MGARTRFARLREALGRVEIPPEELPAVKNRLRGAYLETGRCPEDIPEGIRE